MTTRVDVFYQTPNHKPAVVKKQNKNEAGEWVTVSEEVLSETKNTTHSYVHSHGRIVIEEVE